MEAGKKHIMSVELAIQRELAYRKKVACLLQSDEFMKDLLPLQVPSSALCQSSNPSPKSWSEPSSVTRASPSLFPSSAHRIPSSSPSPRQVPSPPAHQFPPSRSFPPPPCMILPSPRPRPLVGPIQNPIPNAAHWFPSSIPSLGPVPSSAHQFTSSSPSPNLLPSSAHRPSSPVPRPAHQFPSSSPNIPRSFPTPCQVPSPGPRRSLAGLNQNGSLWLTPRPIELGIKRKTMTSRAPHEGNYIVVDTTVGSTYCKLCQVACSGHFNLKQHLNGQKHKSKLEMLQLSEGGAQAAAKKVPFPNWCELCQIGCTNEDLLKMHFQGQKHKKAMLQNLENGGKASSQRPRCKLCQISCMNEDNFAQHLKGQQHIKNLQARQQNTRAYGE